VNRHYPDEETVVDQDIIFDDDSVTTEIETGVKVLSEKSHSEGDQKNRIDSIG
jgi:5'(3')-deoxyribonucleotidase